MRAGNLKNPKVYQIVKKVPIAYQFSSYLRGGKLRLSKLAQSKVFQNTPKYPNCIKNSYLRVHAN